MATRTAERPQAAKGQADGFVDCDSHVEEPEATFDYLDKDFAERRPYILNRRGAPGVCVQDAYWMIDGRQHPRPTGHGATFYGSPPVSTLALNKPYGVPSQTLDDVAARLADMDRNNIRLSVLYPTLFLTNVAEDPVFEAALMRSYNDWLAERCGRSGGRLRFVALIPFRDPPLAQAEIRRAKTLGAVGLFSLGTAGDMQLHDRRLDPVWAEAERQNLPLCIHTGYSLPSLNEGCDSLYMAVSSSFFLPVFMAFVAITAGGVLDRHPGLRIGFFEAGSDWLPPFVGRMDHYHRVVPKVFKLPVPKKSPTGYFAEKRLYMAVDAHDALLPQIVDMLGPEQLLASADMPHAEGRDSELAELFGRADLPAPVRRQILTENTLRFYNIAGG